MDEQQTGEEGRPTSSLELGQFANRVKDTVGSEAVRAFSRRSGISETTLRAYMAGSSDAGRLALIAIANAGGVRLEWLVTGEGAMRASEVREVAPTYGADVGSEFTLVPRYAVDAAAGAGQAVECEIEIGKLAFRQDWVRQKGLTASDLAVIRVRGDSMSPTIRDGALVLVDRRAHHKKPKTDGIYVIQLDGDLLAKRIQVDLTGDGALYIKSDNPAYTDQHLEAAAADKLWIVGRVIWAGAEI